MTLPPDSLAGGLAQVTGIDKSFDEKQFLKDASTVFTAVVETYATGSLGGIADKLSPALLAHFQKAADARKAAGQSAQSRVARMKDAEVIAARTDGTQALITVKFTSDQENILRDARSTIVGGEEGKTEEVTDLWTFARDTATPDAKWVVVETRG
jgi:predicted lipid-binding transport protein (Tim44 family)